MFEPRPLTISKGFDWHLDKAVGLSERSYKAIYIGEPRRTVPPAGRSLKFLIPPMASL